MAVVHLVRQWLCTKRSSKNSVVLQSTRLDVSVCLQFTRESEDMGSIARESESQQAEKASFHLLCPSRSQPAEMWPRVEADLPPSKYHG